MDWAQIGLVILALLFAWLGFRMVRSNPQLFSKENIGRSSTTLGVLTLILIVVVAFCVVMLRN